MSQKLKQHPEARQRRGKALNLMNQANEFKSGYRINRSQKGRS